MPPEVTLQIELALRLVVAAALGAAIGLEREIHAHPAGMGIGAGQYAVGAVGTAIVLFSLWPLNMLADRVRAAGRAPSVRLRLQLRGIDLLGSVTRELSSRRIETTGVATNRVGTGYEIELEVLVRSGADLADALQAIGRLPGVEILETSPPD